MTEQQIESIANVMGFICAILLIITLILACVYLCIYYHKTDIMKQDYINSLNEHDKSVIMQYRNSYWTWRKKKHAKNVSH